MRMMAREDVGRRATFGSHVPCTRSHSPQDTSRSWGSGAGSTRSSGGACPRREPRSTWGRYITVTWPLDAHGEPRSTWGHATQSALNPATQRPAGVATGNACSACNCLALRVANANPAAARATLSSTKLGSLHAASWNDGALAAMGRSVPSRILRADDLDHDGAWVASVQIGECTAMHAYHPSGPLEGGGLQWR